MVARTHGIVAFACLITTAVYYPPEEVGVATVVIALIANTIGSMLPDIDQATNKLWDMLPLGDSVGKFMTKIFPAHRTLSHSFLGIVLFDQLTYWLFPKILNGLYINPWLVSLSLMIGYISHLLADSITEEGLPLLYPLKIKFGLPPVKSWRIKTGQWFEKYIVTPGVMIYIIIFASSQWSTLYRLL